MKNVGYALVLLALSSCWPSLGRVSVVHAQSADQLYGPYRIGHSIKVLQLPGVHCTLDPAGCPPPGAVETRSVDVHLWYPTSSTLGCNNHSSSGSNGDIGCSSAYTSRLHGIPLVPQNSSPQWDPLSWTIGSTQAFERLPILGSQTFPIIVFSHGNDNNAIDYAYTLEALASHGYIVAAPDHVNNTQDDILLDFINPQINPLGGNIPCFDGLPSPCEVLDRYKQDFGKDPVLDSCTQVTSMNFPSPTQSVRESMIDRVSDISAVIDALPVWFGERADISRVGVMGHSRGTVTALAAAGGSTCWGFSADPRVKAIMGLAIGGGNVTFAADVQNVTVPTLLVAGSLDMTAKPAISMAAYNKVASIDKTFVLIPNAEHRHFDSALCAQTQSSGAIATANPMAILDLRTVQTLVSVALTPTSGVAMDFCGPTTFTSPEPGIEPLVTSLTGFTFIPPDAPTNVPDVPKGSTSDTGLTSDAVKKCVVKMAVDFFGRVL
jgi:predicted dienelactone hydrolase